MTNVRRPIHLQLRPAGSIQLAPTQPCGSPKSPLSPTADLLPSQIIPHLFVGDLAQTNRETLNRLNISYILSLGILPLVSLSALSPASPPSSPGSASGSNVPNQAGHRTHRNAGSSPARPGGATSAPATPTTTSNLLMPSRNSSRDFKIRLRAANVGAPQADHSPGKLAAADDENKGVKLKRSIICKCINIADNSEQVLAKFFDEAHQFIEEARRKKANILIHCLAGVSRSPTFAIAYLMRLNSLKLQDAYNLVKQCRPQIDPNLSFIGQLMVYEKSLDERQHRNSRQQVHNQNKYLKSSPELKTLFPPSQVARKAPIEFSAPES